MNESHSLHHSFRKPQRLLSHISEGPEEEDDLPSSLDDSNRTPLDGSNRSYGLDDSRSSDGGLFLNMGGLDVVHEEEGDVSVGGQQQQQQNAGWGTYDVHVQPSGGSVSSGSRDATANKWYDPLSSSIRSGRASISSKGPRDPLSVSTRSSSSIKKSAWDTPDLLSSSIRDLNKPRSRPAVLSSSISSSGSNSGTFNSVGKSEDNGGGSANAKNAPLIFTKPTETDISTREVNIHETPYFVCVDESIPTEYKDAYQYGHELILPKKDEADYVSVESEDEYESLPVGGIGYEKSFFSSQRKMYALLTVGGAIALCLVGIIMAARALGTASTLSYGPGSYNAEYFYLPRYEFGGGSGGMVGIKNTGVRRMEDKTYYESVFGEGGFGDVASQSDGAAKAAAAKNKQEAKPAKQEGPTIMLAPQIVPVESVNPDNVKLLAKRSSTALDLRSFLRKSQDPFDGFGPRQFNPMYDGPKPRDKATLTAAALSSYTPPQEDNVAIVLDPMFNGAMLDVSVLPFNPERELPVFWDVPMTGVSRVQYVLGHCLKLVQCSEVGRDLLEREYQAEGSVSEAGGYTLIYDGLPSTYDPPLKTEFIHLSNFVNVDCSTTHGIDRAVSHHLATSNMVDFVYSTDIQDAARLFAPPIKAYGRGVVMMRHPVERIVALYEYSRLGQGAHGSLNVGSMSFDMFVNSDLVIDNPLTRSLSGNKHSNVEHSHLEVAKAILKRKFVIGLYEKMQESMERFEFFFGWHLDDNARTCQRSELQREKLAHYNRHSKDVGMNNEVHPGMTDVVLERIMAKNKVDLLLFEYAKFLFDYQGRALFELEGYTSR